MGITKLKNVLKWLKKTKTKNEDIKNINGKMFWGGGTWTNGPWKDGIWKDGTWVKEKTIWKFPYNP